MERLKILTWHVHGSYLWYLSHINHDIFLPVTTDRRHGYGGRGATFRWPANVHEIAVEDVRRQRFDAVVYQSAAHYLIDQHDVLSSEQRRLPRIFIEHDPPREHPTDTRHPVDDPETLLVHVTPFNALMWDSGRTPVRVIEHGVTVPDGVRYTGELERGIVVVNNIVTRGRRLGCDLFERARRRVPLDLVGMGASEARGLGEIPPPELPAFEARYRFFFHPVRYTSLGLAVCEAMMTGMPIVTLATAEMATVVEDGVSGVSSTDPERLIAGMRELLRNPSLARSMGERARETARERFGIERFVRDWHDTLAAVTSTRAATEEAVA